MTRVLSSRLDDVTLLTLDRPASLNAINARTIDDLNAAIDEIETDDSVAFVLTGTGRAFSAGADLKEDGVEPNARVAAMHRLVLRLSNLSKPSVAAIDGIAYGGGLELAMACTFRVATSVSRLALPEARLLGALPGYGGTQLLPRIVGPARALEILLTGDPIDAAEAYRIGLVNRLAEDCCAAAADLGRRTSVAGQETFALIRQVVQEGCYRDLDEGLALEAEAARRVGGSAATRAAIAAFARGERR